MRKFTALALLAVVPSLALATPALAQQTQREQPRDQQMQRGERRDHDARQAWRNDQGLVESTRLVGMKVRNAQGKDIGEIDQLLIDPQSGKISHAVVGWGGVLGVGETKVVVPWSDVKVSGDVRGSRDVFAQVDQATLDRAPRYERAASERDRDRPAASPQTAPGMERDRAPAATPSIERDRTRTDGEKK